MSPTLSALWIAPAVAAYPTFITLIVWALVVKSPQGWSDVLLLAYAFWTFVAFITLLDIYEKQSANESVTAEKG